MQKYTDNKFSKIGNYLTASLILVLYGSILVLLFLGVSQLTRKPYPGFDTENYYSVVVKNSDSPSLKPHDVIQKINDITVGSKSNFEKLIDRLSDFIPVKVVILRSGKNIVISIPGAALKKTRFSYRAESIFFQIENSSPESIFHKGDRILSIAGKKLTEDNLGEINKIIYQTKTKNIAPPVVYLSMHRVLFAAAHFKDFKDINFRVIYKYPVFVSELHINKIIPVKKGDQILSIANEDVLNSDQLNEFFIKQSFNSTIPLHIKTKNTYKYVLINLTASQWDRNYVSNTIYLLYILAGFVIGVLLLFQYKRYYVAVSNSLIFLSFSCALIYHLKAVFPFLKYPVILKTPLIFMLPIAFYLFFSNFPISLHKLNKFRPTFIFSSIYAFIFVILFIFNAVSFFHLVNILLLFSFSVALVLVSYSYFSLIKTHKSYERNIFRILYPGLITGVFLPFIGSLYLVISPHSTLTILPSFLLVSIIHLHLVILYYHIKQQILYADVIFKKSFAYTIVSALILFFYFFAVAYLGTFITKVININSNWLLLIFLLFAAFIVEPLKNVVIKLLDALFYRNHLNYREYILKISRELNYLMDIPSILNLFLNTATDVAYIEGGYICLKSASDNNTFIINAVKNPEIAEYQNRIISSDWELVKWMLEVKEPVELLNRKNYPRFSSLSKHEKDFINSLGISLSCPLLSRGELLGILFLKRKLSGDYYSYEDINFIGVLANQAAIALDNAIIREKEKANLRSAFHQKRLAFIGQMAANIAHEIRNPLVAIKGLGKLIENSLEDGDKRKKHMEILNSEVSRLQNVVTELVRFSKPNKLKKESVDINLMIPDAISLYSEEAKKNNIIFDLRLHTEPIFINCDREKIKQVIINLIQNAIEALPDGGTILVETVMYKSEDIMNIYSTKAMIRICDTGKGISPDLREKIFEPFFTSKKTGTGLGLAIVKDIVEEHNGSIRLSNSFNRGTCFEILFPIDSSLGGVPQ